MFNIYNVKFTKYEVSDAVILHWKEKLSIKNGKKVNFITKANAESDREDAVVNVHHGKSDKDNVARDFVQPNTMFHRHWFPSEWFQYCTGLLWWASFIFDFVL